MRDSWPPRLRSVYILRVNILIIGAGDVGRHLGKTLSGEEHDVTIIDKDPAAVERANSQLEVNGLRGNGASPHTLSKIPVSDFELVIAVTESDEANVIAGLTAAKLGAGQVIVRVREQDYFGEDDGFATEELGISFVVHPELATAEDIAEAILTPGAVHVEYFAEGRLAVAEVGVGADSPLLNQRVGDRKIATPHFIVGAEREGEGYLVNPDYLIREGDRLYLIAASDDIGKASAEIAGQAEKVHSAVIFGGGRIGLPLAKKLGSRGIKVTVLEKDGQQARKGAEMLPDCDVLHEEGVSKEALLTHGVDSAGVFVASAGDDRANLLAGEQAKSLGVDLCLAVISREEFVPLVENMHIDAAYAPRLVAAEAILRFVRGRDIKAVHLLFSGCQLLEIEVESGCKAENKPIETTEGWQVGAFIRGDSVVIPQGQESFQAGDLLLLFGPQQASRDIAKQFHNG